LTDGKAFHSIWQHITRTNQSHLQFISNAFLLTIYLSSTEMLFSLQSICCSSIQHGFKSILLIVVHSGYFYSSSSSPLPLRGAPDTARILRRSFTPKRHRQLRVKDLPKVPTWRLEWDSNSWHFGWKATNLPMSTTIQILCKNRGQVYH